MKAVSLANWQRVFTADGILLIPPEGRMRGALRIHDRVRPLCTVRQIIDRMVARRPPGISEVRLKGFERTVTAEGEFAVLLSLTAKASDGSHVDRHAGVIFGDDFYTIIDAVFQNLDSSDALRATVEHMVFNYSLGLGDTRRRRYLYDPPPGWIGIGRVHATSFIPPDHPNHSSRIDIFEARRSLTDPSTMQDHLLFETLPGDLAPDAPQRPIAVRAKQGMLGKVTVVSGFVSGSPRTFFHTAELTDGFYTYLMRLSCEEQHLDVDREVFLTLIRSAECLPRSRPAPAAGSLIHWVD